MKKKILGFVLAVCLIVPSMLMLTACGGITIKGNTFVYDSYSTAGYDDLTTNQLAIIDEFAGNNVSINSEEDIVTWITNSTNGINSIKFSTEKVGVYNDTDDNKTFDYYKLYFNSSDISHPVIFWVEDYSANQLFISVHEADPIINYFYIINTTSGTQNLKIEVNSGEAEGDKLKVMAYISYSDSANTTTSFNSSIAIYYTQD